MSADATGMPALFINQAVDSDLEQLRDAAGDGQRNQIDMQLPLHITDSTPELVSRR